MLVTSNTASVGTVRRPAHGRSDGPAELDASALAASALRAVRGDRVVRTRDVTGHRREVCTMVATVRGAARWSAVTTTGRDRYLVKGSDPSLVAQGRTRWWSAWSRGGDPSMMVEEFGGPGVDQFDVGVVIDACTTPPFLVEPSASWWSGGRTDGEKQRTPNGSSPT